MKFANEENPVFRLPGFWTRPSRSLRLRCRNHHRSSRSLHRYYRNHRRYRSFRRSRNRRLPPNKDV